RRRSWKSFTYALEASAVVGTHRGGPRRRRQGHLDRGRAPKPGAAPGRPRGPGPGCAGRSGSSPRRARWAGRRADSRWNRVDRRRSRRPWPLDARRWARTASGRRRLGVLARPRMAASDLPGRVSWAGSALGGDWYRAGVGRALARAGLRARWVAPARPPVAAAARLAEHLAGKNSPATRKNSR